MVENESGGDCLFMTILGLLKSNKLIVKKSHLELREMIVREAVSDLDFLQLQEIKFNLENNVQFFSTLDMNDLQKNDELQKRCAIAYSDYMTRSGHYGTLFELRISTQLFDFNVVVFMKQGDIFKCFDIDVSDDDTNVTKPKLFILFTGSTYSGHFRLLKPSTIDCLKTSDRIPRGEYSIFKEDKSSCQLKKGLPQTNVASQLLFFGDSTIHSQVGSQQGDGQPDVVLSDFKSIIETSARVGLSINPPKCELHFCGEINNDILEAFNELSPGIQVIQSDIELLGAPLTLHAASKLLLQKLDNVKASFDKLKTITSVFFY